MSSNWQGKVILITGAGSGIGRALAQLFASQGASLVLTDINQDGLLETQSTIKSSVLIAEQGDVSNRSDWITLRDKISKGPGYLDVLINNAGMTSFGAFDETSEALFDKVMNVNFQGVVYGCREMLPLLEQSSNGLIVNISSIFGLITMPMMSPYHASKFAVRGFTEALKQDLKWQGSNVDVVCVMPGGIRTNIANNAETDRSDSNALAQHFETVSRTTPDQAARVIEKGMRLRTFRILIGLDAKIVDCLWKVLPTQYYKVSNLLLGVDKVLSKKEQTASDV